MWLSYDLRERRGGYSAVKRFANNDIYISLGQDHENNLPVAVVDLKKLNIEVTGNKDLYSLCEEFLANQMSVEARTSSLNKIIALLASKHLNKYEDFLDVTSLFYEYGKAAGKQELQEGLKELLNIRGD